MCGYTWDRTVTAEPWNGKWIFVRPGEETQHECKCKKCSKECDELRSKIKSMMKQIHDERDDKALQNETPSKEKTAYDKLYDEAKPLSKDKGSILRPTLIHGPMKISKMVYYNIQYQYGGGFSFIGYDQLKTFVTRKVTLEKKDLSIYPINLTVEISDRYEKTIELRFSENYNRLEFNDDEGIIIAYKTSNDLGITIFEIEEDL